MATVTAVSFATDCLGIVLELNVRDTKRYPKEKLSNKAFIFDFDFIQHFPGNRGGNPAGLCAAGALLREARDRVAHLVQAEVARRFHGLVRDWSLGAEHHQDDLAGTVDNLLSK